MVAPVVSTGVFVLLAVGWANRLTLGLVAAAGVSAALLGFRGAPAARIRIPGLAAALLAAYGLYYLVHALTPEIQPDGYSYHLGLVREWTRLGRFPGRAGFFETLPKGLEMLFTIAYAFGRHSAAKLVHFGFLLASVPLILRVGERLGMGRWRAVAAALIYFFTPVVGVSGTSAYVDAALAFFTLAAFWLLLGAWDGERHAFLPLGVVAGFCYAIKPTGAIVVVAVLVVVAWRRNWRGLVRTALGAALIAAPWIVRNAWLTGNPVAPLMNRWFPNPYFHPADVERLSDWFRDYGGVSPLTLPLELTVRGHLLQGLTGPLFLGAGLALLAVRRRGGGWLLAGSGVAMTPWLANHGTRFLIPALIFLSLALAAALPRRILWAAVAFHAITCAPPVMAFYEDAGAWRLRGLPWRAALRLESEETYLRRELWEYRIAELIRAQAKAGEPVLDLVGAPGAYFDAVAIAPWQSARGGRALEALEAAASSEPDVFHAVEARWAPAPVSALRLRLVDDAPSWSIQEVRVLSAGRALGANLRWRLRALPNPWESPLAFDRNAVSQWATRGRVAAGSFLEVDFGRPELLDGVTLLTPRSEGAARIVADARGPDGRWRVLAADPLAKPVPDLNRRREAIRVLRREGFRFILAPFGREGLGPLGRDLAEHRGDWGIEPAGVAGHIYLFRVHAPAPAVYREAELGTLDMGWTPRVRGAACIGEKN